MAKAAAMLAMAVVLAFAVLAQARTVEEQGLQVVAADKAVAALVPELSDLEESWVGHASTKQYCGSYVQHGVKKQVKCKSFHYCRKNKCVTLLAIVLSSIFGFLVLCVIIIVLCCCCCPCFVACCACFGLSRDVDSKEVQMEGGPAVQV